jgi:hypothetical protein
VTVADRRGRRIRGGKPPLRRGPKQ